MTTIPSKPSTFSPPWLKHVLIGWAAAAPIALVELLFPFWAMSMSLFGPGAFLTFLAVLLAQGWISRRDRRRGPCAAREGQSGSMANTSSTNDTFRPPWLKNVIIAGAVAAPIMAFEFLFLFHVGLMPERVFNAAREGDFETVKSMIERHPRLVKALGGGHCKEASFLQSAVMGGHVQIAQYLITKGADVNYKRYWDPPLYLAVWNEDEAMMKLLLSRGADPNLRSKGGLSSFDLAEGESREDLVELMLQYAPRVRHQDTPTNTVE